MLKASCILVAATLAAGTCTPVSATTTGTG